MTPNLGLNAAQRDAVVRILNSILADEYILYTKTRNYHWNVTGPRFNDLHKFFEAQYDILDESIDAIAERARSLGGQAVATLAEFAALTRLKEQPGQKLASGEMLANLLSDHETVIRQLRTDVAAAQDTHSDAGTADFFTGLMEQHEKMAWMLRSFLEE
ncbi:MAG: Dps family protein [Bryobacteraceae bacterium]